MAELPFMKMKLRMTMRSPSLAVWLSLRRMEEGCHPPERGGGHSNGVCPHPPTSQNHPGVPHQCRFSPSARGRLLVRM